MNQLEVLKKARFNTALLALSFLGTTVQASQTGSTLLAVVGVLAFGLTVRDGFQVHNAIKEVQGATNGN